MNFGNFGAKKAEPKAEEGMGTGLIIALFIFVLLILGGFAYYMYITFLATDEEDTETPEPSDTPEPYDPGLIYGGDEEDTTTPPPRIVGSPRSYQGTVDQAFEEQDNTAYRTSYISQDYVAMSSPSSMSVDKCASECFNNENCQTFMYKNNGCVGYTVTDLATEIDNKASIYTVKPSNLFIEILNQRGPLSGSDVSLPMESEQDLDECSRGCYLTTACKSFGYNPTDQKCIGYSSYSTDVEQEADTNWNLYDLDFSKGFRKIAGKFSNEYNEEDKKVFTEENTSVNTCLEKCADNSECKTVAHNTKTKKCLGVNIGWNEVLTRFNDPDWDTYEAAGE